MKKILFALLLVTGHFYGLAQNVGIGTTTPIARLHVADSNVVFTGSNNADPNTPFAPPIQGPGARMMWYPAKAAFRAGLAFGNQWDKDSIGILSIALGNSTRAKGESSFASGAGSNASGYRSTAMGDYSTASGATSFAAGNGNISSGDNATAIGTQSLASGIFSAAIGIHAVSSGNSAVALGDSAIAAGTEAIAAGAYVTAKARASFATGWRNDNTDNPDPDFISPSDRIFQIGNGNGFTLTRSNALTVLRNANTGIAITNPRFPLSFNGNSGDKISLYDDGNPSQLHFGFGIFSNQLLQVQTPTVYDDIAFGFGNSAAFTERVRIKGNGRVGIGTTTPVARLHVADSSLVFTAPSSLPASPANPPVSGAGTRMMWYPDKAALRAGNANLYQWDKDSIGNYSFAAGASSQAKGISSTALGNFSKANGDYSFSAGNAVTASGLYSVALGTFCLASGSSATGIGYNTEASGDNAVALGYITKARGNASTALGNQTIASGAATTALGLFTIAKSDYSMVVGKFNDTTTVNPIFEVGNGTANNARNNAVTILSNGSALFTAPATLPGVPGNPPAIGAGNRMMWYADKAAFRAGNIINDSWDKDKTGNMSFAAGSNTQAMGVTSSAFGNFAFANGDISFAAGNSVFAKAKSSATFGAYNDITDASSATTEVASDRIFQVGNGSSNGSRSNALTILRNGNVGVGNMVPDVPLAFTNSLGSKIALYSTGTTTQYGFGIQSGLLQMYSDGAASDIVFGYGGSTSFTEKVRIKGNGNVGIGNNNPTRPLSFPASLGEKILLYPGGVGETGIGVYGNELRLHADNPAAKVSFGTQDNAGNYSENALAQRNGIYAFSVLGSLWVNGTTYASDERFKQNITAIQSPLQKLMQLNGVEYEMKVSEFPKNHFQPGRQMGLLAQNVEKVVPEAVNELDGYKGVDYARLVPLLIESIKELKKEIEELKKH